jgi:PAS domain S-box-containing protein
MSVWLDAIVCSAGVALAGAAAEWHRRTSIRLLAGERRLALKAAEIDQREASGAQVETRYRTLFDSVPVAIVITRIQGSVIDVNTACLQLFGYHRAEFMTLDVKNLFVNPAERERRIAQALKEVAPRTSEHLMRRRDGTTFPGLVQNYVVRDAHGEPDHLEGFVTDVSELKRIEAERLKAEQDQRISTRLQSVGALAAGIAHEINTPMQFVSDSVYFLKDAIRELDTLWPEMARLATSGETPEKAVSAVARLRAAAADIDVPQLAIDANESAERALEGVRRVTKIIRAMREFAHPDNGERTLVDLNHAIETTLTVCRNVYREVAEVETAFGEIPQIMCQYGEINQVLLNIIVNAAHAIEVRGQRAPKGMIRISTLRDGDWAVIRVADNGSGIPESVKSRIFDPFFTTKEVGKGTGQGLAIARSVVVERHRGHIGVESEVGKGTTFELRLPVEASFTQPIGVRA